MDAQPASRHVLADIADMGVCSRFGGRGVLRVFGDHSIASKRFSNSFGVTRNHLPAASWFSTVHTSVIIA